MASMSIADMSIADMSMVSADDGSTSAARSAGRSSLQISSKNGRPFAGMNPGGVYARDEKTTSIMLAIRVRVIRVPGLKRISKRLHAAGKLYQQKGIGVSRGKSVDHVTGANRRCKTHRTATLA
jgi:hypothetical protein